MNPLQTLAKFIVLKVSSDPHNQERRRAGRLDQRYSFLNFLQ
jgi:hypothetical protein